MNLSNVGFGVTGNLDEDVVRWLAPRVEEAGFRTLWFNDTQNGDSLARVQIAASVTSRIGFGTGVIPLDRKPADTIIEQIRELDLPQDRLLLGVGSGSTRQNALELVRTGIHQLRNTLTAPIIVGALGPRMRRLGAQESHGILLNWLTPATAKLASEEMQADAAMVGKEKGHLVTYVRTALGDAASERVKGEAARYSTVPGYAANFARLGITALEASVIGNTGTLLQEGLSRYEGIVDEVVVRAITESDTADQFEALIAALVA